MAAARELGTAGVILADAGKCSEAIEKLSRAAELYAAPTIVARLGECQVEVGQLVAGCENLQRVVREELAPDASKPFVTAKERARRVLDASLPRIAKLLIVVEGAEQSRLDVRVDGVEVPAALLGAARPTDPGVRRVTAGAPGFRTASASVTLDDGEQESVTLRLERDPNEHGPAIAAQPGPPVQPMAEAPRSDTLAWVLVGVGAAGIASGSVLGALALQKKSDLESQCPERRCPESQRDDLDSANTLALGSTIGFGVGIAAAGVGAVLLLTGGSSGEVLRSSRRRPATHARPFVGLGALGVAGSF
jgi:hypothetical protein